MYIVVSMMHQQAATSHYNSAQGGSQHYQGQSSIAMMSQSNQGNSMMGQRPMGPYRASQQGEIYDQLTAGSSSSLMIFHPPCGVGRARRFPSHFYAIGIPYRKKENLKCWKYHDNQKNFNLFSSLFNYFRCLEIILSKRDRASLKKR